MYLLLCGRIRSLYKLTSRYADAEEHVRKYIGMMERHESSVAVRREMATAYALLASIYDLVRTADSCCLPCHEMNSRCCTFRWVGMRMHTSPT